MIIKVPCGNVLNYTSGAPNGPQLFSHVTVKKAFFLKFKFRYISLYSVVSSKVLCWVTQEDQALLLVKPGCCWFEQDVPGVSRMF